MSTILDDYAHPPGYLEEEQTRNLREAIGEELWEWLEILERLGKRKHE